MRKLLFFGMLLLNAQAFSSDKGNGGGAHLCPNENSIQMYDIYEGITRYNITPDFDASMSVEQYIQKALAKMTLAHPGIGLKLKENLDYLMAKGHLIKRYNLNMPYIEDANILVVNIGCLYEQLANWDNVSGNVLVKGELFDRLDNLNKAALYVHEALYKFARDSINARNSDNVRRVVAEAFNAEAEFSHIKEWASWSNMVTILKDPKPYALAINQQYSNTIYIDLHLGDNNYYDSNRKVEIILKRDYTAVKKFITETQTLIATLEKEKIEINKKIQKAIFSSRKKEYIDILDKIERQVKDKEYDLRFLKSIDLGIVEVKGSSPGKFDIYKNYEMDSRVVAKYLKTTLLVIINGKIIDEQNIKYDIDYFRVEISQNRK